MEILKYQFMQVHSNLEKTELGWTFIQVVINVRSWAD